MHATSAKPEETSQGFPQWKTVQFEIEGYLDVAFRAQGLKFGTLGLTALIQTVALSTSKPVKS